MARYIPLWKILPVIAAIALTATGCKNAQKKEPQTAPVAADSKTAPVSASSEQASCPVCGLSFPRNEAVATESYKGKTYYFYLADHHKAFKADPEQYLLRSE